VIGIAVLQSAARRHRIEDRRRSPTPACLPRHPRARHRADRVGADHSSVVIWVWTVQGRRRRGFDHDLPVLVGISDNLLKPVLMGRGLSTPVLVIFIGVMAARSHTASSACSSGQSFLRFAWELLTAWTGQEPEAAALSWHWLSSSDRSGTRRQPSALVRSCRQQFPGDRKNDWPVNGRRCVWRACRPSRDEDHQHGVDRPRPIKTGVADCRRCDQHQEDRDSKLRRRRSWPCQTRSAAGRMIGADAYRHDAESRGWRRQHGRRWDACDLQYDAASSDCSTRVRSHPGNGCGWWPGSATKSLLRSGTTMRQHIPVAATSRGPTEAGARGDDREGIMMVPVPALPAINRLVRRVA